MDILHYLDTQMLAVIAAVGALATALVNYGQGRIAARANAAQLYIEFSRRYNAPEISEAIQALTAWRRRHGESFAEVFQAAYTAQDTEAIRISAHRRTLNRYFVDIARAYRAGVLSKTFAKLAADHPGAAVWRHIVVPMNIAHYGGEDAGRYLKILLRLVPELGEREVF